MAVCLRFRSARLNARPQNSLSIQKNYLLYRCSPINMQIISIDFLGHCDHSIEMKKSDINLETFRIWFSKISNANRKAIEKYLFDPKWSFNFNTNWQMAFGIAFTRNKGLGQDFKFISVWFLCFSFSIGRSILIPYTHEEAISN